MKITGYLVATYCLVSLFTCGCGGAKPEPGPPSSGASPSPAPASKPVLKPLADYRVEWASHQIPTEMKAGAVHTAAVTLKNTGSSPWPGKGDEGFANRVALSYHWLSPDADRPVEFDGIRTPFSHDIAPGETISVNNVQVLAPKTPGSYRLQLTLVHELVAWFENKGARTVIVPVAVR
jgi:hypothetical protein